MVKNKTANKTAKSSFGAKLRILNTLKSIISNPIFIKIAAKTQIGICEINQLHLKNTSAKNKALKIVVNLVIAPFFTAATLLIVAAEPSIEPVIAQIKFPKPCIKISFLELCFFFVNESKITPVNKLSLEATNASVKAIGKVEYKTSK